MIECSKEYLWSGKWSIEDDIAWFVAGGLHVLFSINMATNHYKVITSLPGTLNTFRKNPNCIKCENSVFCMPDIGDCIWSYDLSITELKKVQITNPNHVNRIGIWDFWRCGKILWAVSTGLKQILEIDTEKKEVIGYYNITDKKEEILAQSAKIENYIYVVCSSKSMLYEFNTETKEIRRHEFNQINDNLRTISISKGKVWLSGCKKKIYIWEQMKDELKILEDFPDDFGVYKSDKTGKMFLDTNAEEYHFCTFVNSVDAGDYIWFIPYQTNYILYVNKNTDEIKTFSIVGEDENGECIKNRVLDEKYLLQYIYLGRYIGLYSLKNEVVIEIDALSMETKVRDICIDVDGTEKISCGWILQEKNKAECSLYEKLIGNSYEYKVEKKMTGKNVFDFVR